MTTATHPNYEVRVGIFSTIALIILFWGWGWLKSISLFHHPQEFTVQFHDVAGLNKNATVNINGVRVGVVEGIELKSAGQVLVHPKITAENVVVSRGSHITIQTLGLVGAKYLEVTLPRPIPGEPPPPPIESDEIVIGEDPVRIELILSDLGTFARQMVNGMTGQRIGTNLGIAVKNIGDLSDKLNTNMANFKVAAQSVTTAADKFGSLADHAKSTANDADTFFVEGQKSFSKVNKILDKPMFSSDLNSIVDKAKTASEQIANAMHEISSTLGNDNTRRDLMSIMDKLSQSTENIARSIQTIDGIARDKDLRGDVKDILVQTKDTISKLNATLDRAEFKGDLPGTMKQLKQAATDVDIVAKQLQQVLSQKHPLVHMMFGRPGKLKEKETSTKETTKTQKSNGSDQSSDSSSTPGSTTTIKEQTDITRSQEILPENTAPITRLEPPTEPVLK